MIKRKERCTIMFMPMNRDVDGLGCWGALGVRHCPLDTIPEMALS